MAVCEYLHSPFTDICFDGELISMSDKKSIYNGETASQRDPMQAFRSLVSVTIFLRIC